MTWLLRERLLGWRQEIEGERFAAAPVLVYPIKARSMLLLLEPALVLASTLAALGGGWNTLWRTTSSDHGADATKEMH